ncbi:TNF receptor-associated factor 5-like [Phytophthora cinnamomi]|uniref:TNF receptor-associated factor 5-like n=1 Tax=Phytophthora cinnamomi TaxID=4785 RepID=UPI00355ACCD5|nr:TNF receptor-associated factor 5-like [Phytophthora cinnamomi]
MSTSDGWHCPICLGSFERPVLASCCGQSFCRSCLDAALRQVDACPMCRSPLLSGPFSVTPNRALEEALAALASSSPRRSATSTQEATSFVDAVERKLAASARNSASEVRISVPNTAENDDNAESLIHGEEQQPRRGGDGSRWRGALGLCRIRGLESCRRRAVIGRRCVRTRSAELRRRLRQWQLWCRVNWASLQCVFYVLLFFVFVFFLRVQEEEFAETTRHLRRPN